jgi:hypothetical protein
MFRVRYSDRARIMDCPLEHCIVAELVEYINLATYNLPGAEENRRIIGHRAGRSNI